MERRRIGHRQPLRIRHRHGKARPLEKAAQVDGLRRVKDDVKEVREGFDCGILISAYQDIKEGDVIEFYALREVKRTLGD